MKVLAIAMTGLLASGPTSAVSEEERPWDPLVDIYLLTATSAGVLARCGEGRRHWVELQQMSDGIAAHRHPGVVARLTGARARFAEQIADEARAEFVRSRDAGACPPTEEVISHRAAFAYGAQGILERTDGR